VVPLKSDLASKNTTEITDRDRDILKMMLAHKVTAKGMNLTELNSKMNVDFGLRIGGNEDEYGAINLPSVQTFAVWACPARMQTSVIIWPV
jgi:hypothetical protein